MATFEKTELKTLASCMNSLQRDGFKENFVVKEKGLQAMNAEKFYTPAEVRIINFYRFEGDSDPADNAILYAIETQDGKRGILSDAYGAYADAKVSKFFEEVEEIMKKTNPADKI